MDRRTVISGLGALTLAGVPGVAAAAPPGHRKVPKGFLWGSAISAHQSEGNNVNSDMWLNETVPGTLFREPSGDACDSYHRYGEDMRIAASLGFNCYRFGIEWARIEPRPGVFSLAELDHYKTMLETCHALGLSPMVTFCHFTTPRWFAARGGFEAPDAPDLFARFAGTAAGHFGSLLTAATTFNEINAPRLITVLAPGSEKARPLIDRMLAASARACGSDRFGSWIFADAVRIEPPTRIAHVKAYAAIKAAGPAKVGISLSMQEFQPATGGTAKVAALNRALYDTWLEPSVPSDFIGVQTYTRVMIGPDGALPVPTGAEQTDSGYEYYPPALGAMVRYAAQASGKPVFITESGIATGDDARRIAFIDATLAEVRQCLADGIDLRGYLHWSLLDNYEWTRGYDHRFGLVAVDRKTFKRTPKASAHHLGRIVKSGLI
ncbi:beta-glucosidase [Sphingomonas sp. Leaf357]|uniref:glycoside hydrolase family 1 protein n=1 Tax=Sphingomonas sp. Leaf357 TaxID=1736350 RepID=UPI0006F84672|nr:family 1 glycosylhydrolase [Sphingomonas sp. Leaf357]KQS04959.1 beta-glucosidase [Sphingomonas sp. Leaf357]